jgi:hypothetical protein
MESDLKNHRLPLKTPSFHPSTHSSTTTTRQSNKYGLPSKPLRPQEHYVFRSINPRLRTPRSSTVFTAPTDHEMQTYATHIIEPSHFSNRHIARQTRIVEPTRTPATAQDARKSVHMPTWFRTKSRKACEKAHAAHLSMLRDVCGKERVEVLKDRGSASGKCRMWIVRRRGR